MATTVMSHSRSQGTEVTTVTGAFPFELHETSQRILHYGNDIQFHRERGYEQPAPFTHSAKIEYTHTHSLKKKAGRTNNVNPQSPDGVHRSLSVRNQRGRGLKKTGQTKKQSAF